MTIESGPTTIDVSKLLWVEVLEAKPNKMFTEEHRQIVRFLRYSKAVPCAACGKKRKLHWTMLCQFTAMKMAKFAMSPYPKVFDPLTAVCSDHPLGLPESVREAAAV